MSPWRLLVTRAQPGAAQQAQALNALGHYAVAEPLLAVTPLPPPALDLSRFSAVVVISQPAAQGLLPLLAGQRVPPLFAVGAASAGVLSAQGHAVRWPAEGEDSEALLALPALRSCLAMPTPCVLIVRGQGGREALAEGLREQGASVEYLELYQRTCPVSDGAALVARIQAERLNALVVSSGQGFEYLQALAAQHWPHLARLALLVPSQRVAAQAQAAGAQRVIVCAGASTAALVECLAAQAAPLVAFD